LDGCQFINNQVTGIYMSCGTSTGGADISIVGTKIVTAATSVWSALTDYSIRYSSGVTVGNYFNGTINIVGCSVSGAEYGLWAIDQVTYNVTGSDITGTNAAIWTYGGGTLKATGNKLVTTTGDRVVGRNTNNFASLASYNLYTYVSNNYLECAVDNSTNYPVALGGNGALFSETVVSGNAAPKGVMNVFKGSATLFDVDFGTAWSPVIRGSGTAGTYELDMGNTRCTYTRLGRVVTLNAYIVLAGAITGGGTGELQIAGLPYDKRDGSSAWGSVACNLVAYSDGKQLTVYFGGVGVSSLLYFWESASAGAVTLTPISAINAGDVVAFSVSYEI